MLFNCFCQSLISGRKTGHWAMSPPKLHALRAKNVLIFQRVLRANVLMCQRANVLTYQRALRVSVLTCQHVLRAYVLTCQRILRAYVPTCSCAHVPTCLEGLRASRVNMPCVLMYSHVAQHGLSPLLHTACVTKISPANMLCLISNLMPLFSVSLPLLLKLYTLLVRFKSLMNVFLQ